MLDGEVLLSVRGLRVAYGGIQAVKGLDLEAVHYTHLPPPTILCLMY